MTNRLLFLIVVGLWVTSELATAVILRSGRRNASSKDRGSLALLWLAIAVATFLGALLSGVRTTRIAHGNLAFWCGMALLIGGSVLRWTAILTLRRYFTVDVAIHADHELIDRGLYSVLRHPSYAGSLLSFLGLGLAMGNWLSAGIILLVTFAVFARRMAIEERALTERFGDRYLAYMARTKRLVPFVY
jgi:protein-S-isoprenylcysteine O-methyltransferase Ste14